MSRKIKAKTLGKLVSRYVADFPSEAAGHLADADSEDCAELLGLLPGELAWKLLRSAPSARSRGWLMSCNEETLRRLIRHADPGGELPPDAEPAALGERAAALLVG